MAWEKVTENDPSEQTLHVGENRGPEAGEVTSIVTARGRVMAYDQEDHEAVFAGSDDGFVAIYDDKLNFEKDWKAHDHGVNCVAAGKDEQETVCLINLQTQSYSRLLIRCGCTLALLLVKSSSGGLGQWS